MRKMSLCGLCLCLSLLAVSPSFLAISSLPTLPTEPKLLSVRTESSTGSSSGPVTSDKKQVFWQALGEEAGLGKCLI
jgi:hypothetical protein